MKEYDFTLKFDLPHAEEDPEQYIDALYEAGCDDASVGIGQIGSIGLNFIRESDSAVKAVLSAIADVSTAIPGARLIEATPDLVGLTDIAEIIGCSRQNMRKMFSTHRTLFPQPIHEGSLALWHLADVLQCFKENNIYEIEDELLEVSIANMQVNLARQIRSIDPALRLNLKSLRMFLAAQGGGRKGDLSRFIEDAVRERLFKDSVAQAKAETAHLKEAELTAIIDEAVKWARSNP